MKERTESMPRKDNRIKRIKKTIALTAFLACAAHAEAPQKQKDFTHDFTLGIEGGHYQYSEAGSQHKHFMHFKGLMGGINANYQLTYKDKIFLRPEARVMYGKAEYENWTGSESRMRTPSAIVEPRLLVGIPVKVSEKLTISPYSGLGHRYKWDNDSKEKSADGATGAKRRNYCWYIPVGTRFQYDLNERWNLQGNAEYDFFLSGTQISGGEKDMNPSLKFNQTQGKGLKGEFLVGRKFDHFTISTGIYAHYWKIKKTNKRPYFLVRSDGGWKNAKPFEPKNVTTEIGFKLTLGF